MNQDALIATARALFDAFNARDMTRANGQIAREQTVWNQFDLFQQLGLMPGAST